MNRHRELAQMMRAAAPVGGGWWNAGGIDNADVLAAFDPITSSSYADSLINRVNPGTNNASTLEGSPGFSNGTGWILSGGANTGDALSVPFPFDDLGTDFIVLMRISNVTGTTDGYLTGFSAANTNRINFLIARTQNLYGRLGSSSAAAAPPVTSGVVGVRRTNSNATTELWANGAVSSSQGSTYENITARAQTPMGCTYLEVSTQDYGNFYNGNIAAALFLKNPTNSQIIAVSSAMAAL